MLTMKSDAPDTIPAVLKVLQNDGVVAIPTETVYGLACRWDSQPARELIYRLKRRPANKLLQMLADSVEMAVRAGLRPDPRLARIARRFWPGALTLVAPATNGNTIGLRIPAHPFTLELLGQLMFPLACTSANLSGHPAGLTAEQAIAELDGEPHALVDGGPVPPSGGLPSTVAALTPEGIH
ncbi:MAG: L-threonylcarbamoyladenylate synthase, partial [Victivallales bacterium]|nr:L-threonylcarbamoyladenylate synthase [Victivallales bacterium]